jgi:ribosomal protein L40E
MFDFASVISGNLPFIFGVVAVVIVVQIFARKKCPHCKSEIPKSATKCAKCGSDL